MPTVERTIAMRDVLVAARVVQNATTNDALAAVALARLRRVLEPLSGPTLATFHALADDHAVRAADGTPVPLLRPDGSREVWQLTGTPAVAIAPDRAAAHRAAADALLAGTVALRISPLTDRDLAAIAIPRAFTTVFGDALLVFMEDVV